MAERRQPPEKKILSYQKDRRNTYGESGARSRFAIRRRKAWVNRSYRHAVREELALAVRSDDPGENAVDEVVRKAWRKRPDEALGAVIGRKRTRRFRTGGVSELPENSDLQQEAKRRRSQSGDRPMETW